MTDTDAKKWAGQRGRVVGRRAVHALGCGCVSRAVKDELHQDEMQTALAAARAAVVKAAMEMHRRNYLTSTPALVAACEALAKLEVKRG